MATIKSVQKFVDKVYKGENMIVQMEYRVVDNPYLDLEDFQSSLADFDTIEEAREWKKDNKVKNPIQRVAKLLDSDIDYLIDFAYSSSTTKALDILKEQIQKRTK